MVRIIDNYTLLEMVGEGAYGKVYRAINKLDKKEYAVKVIEAKKFHADKKLEEYTVNEINILTNMEKSSHIIGYFDMLKSQTNFYFVYEFCNGGTLQNLINKRKKLPEDQALKIFKQLLDAFKLLYKYNVVHRDLKPDNIFFKDGIVKLGDFGFCKSLEKTKMTRTMLGSPIYMAPEILKGEVYSSKADIWSMGVVLFQMLYGYCPFESSSIPKLLEVLESCDVSFPENTPVSQETKDVIRRILTKNPKKRIQWKDLFDVQITEQGKIASSKNTFGFLVGHSSSRDLKRKNLSKTSINRSASKEHEMTPRMHRPQTTVLLKPKIQESQPQIVTEKKLHPIQEDTDDQSRKNKLIRRQKAFTKIKAPSIDERQNFGNTNGNFQTYIKRVTSRDKNAFSNKQRVVTRHSEIIQGNSIARNLQCVNEKHNDLFSVVIYRMVVSRLGEFLGELRDSQEYLELIILVSNELEELGKEISHHQSKCQELSHVASIEEFSVSAKRLLRNKIPECRHLRLCYQMTMYLANENVCGGLTNEEMNRIISLKLA